MISIRRLSSRDDQFSDQLSGLLSAGDNLEQELIDRVSAILLDVSERGDDALLAYTNRFDRRQIGIDEIELGKATLDQSLREIPENSRSALEAAAARIYQYHERQKAASWRYQDDEGVTLGQRVTPLDRVGIYVPGGKAAYPSSVLMNAIPARVAGVTEIIMAVPAMNNELNPIVLAAAKLAGVDRIFSIGGAQAIAALAYGTETVPAVDKIVGPGNRYVAAAKRLVFGKVGIDMIAGPSEVVIVADTSANADWVAMDLFAQAEHDEDARAVLITTDPALADNVEQSMNRDLDKMQRAEIIKASLQNNGAFICVKNMDEAASLVNELAPEHLQLAVQNPDTLLQRIRHAGAIFIGHFSAEVLGDYCAGPNHVLPTGRAARFSSPLGVYDFQKRSSIIECGADAAAKLAPTATVLAHSEGLTAHARSARYRMRRETASDSR